MKKKLDFYLATGKLPPVAKNNLQNNVRDTERPTCSEKLMVGSNKESDSSAQTSSGGTDFHVPGGTNTKLGLSSELQETGPASCHVDECADSDVVEQSSHLEHSYRNSNSLPLSLPLFDRCRNADRVVQNEDAVTPVQPVYGSLYYKPPQYETCSPSESNLTNSCTQPDCSPALLTSRIGFFTPPSVKSNGASVQSPESILKVAAMTFPNTPSIMRKRRVQFHTPQTQKNGKFDEKGGCSSSIDQLSAIHQSRHQDEGLVPTPPSHPSVVTAFCNGMSFNASPPYRLRTKRMAILKSVEKQLEFTLDKEKEGDTKSLELPFRGNTPLREGISHTKMGVT